MVYTRILLLLLIAVFAVPAHAQSGGTPEIPVIRLTSPLPAITDSLTIDGTTQEGGLVHIDGVGAGAADGLSVQADSVTLHGLMITGFGGYGVRFSGGKSHLIDQSYIGVDTTGVGGPGSVLLNGAGGILVENGATDVTIGALEEAAINHIAGGVHVTGETTRGIRVLKNVLEVPADWLAEDVTGVPIDLDGDGPTCSPWDVQSAPLPNNHMPPPRITALSRTAVEGLAQPGATVIVYKATDAGTQRGRYWARRVEPVAHGKADVEGYFNISVNLAIGDSVTVTAMDVDGNTSELAQLRRPVIFLPGIGGSWLTAADGTRLWIPITALTDAEKNNRLFRMQMDENGEDIEALNVDGVLELGGHAVYGPILKHLQEAGFAGAPTNDNPETLDLWRFPNDWRKSTYLLAQELKGEIDRITGHASNVARSCEVDLVAHSNGGLIASVYLKRYGESQDKVHRFLTLGTPYLGTPQAAAAHTSGYIFDVEKSLFFDVEWGRMTEMTRNVPGAYGLMPSEAYWEASSIKPELVDLYGEPLTSYDAVMDFLTRDKTNPDGIPWGMNRNASIWEKEQANVHDRIDDWRAWHRPPQIMRFVGSLPVSTTEAWFLGPGPEYLEPDETERSEVGDTDRHRAYRERLRPSLGTGDGTVAISSATLGRDAIFGGTDFSGVDESHWIDEFEYYDCTHTGLVEKECERISDDKKLLDRVVEVLRSGYEVLPGGTAGAFNGTSLLASNTRAKAVRTTSVPVVREVFHVFGSVPLMVEVADEAGNSIGPASDDSPKVIEYGLPEVGYWPSTNGATLSIPAGNAYTVQVRAYAGNASVQVFRIMVDGANESQHLLFPVQNLSDGGSLRFELRSEGTDEGASFEVDADGNGVFEASLAPETALKGTSAVPAIPFPRPAAVVTASGTDTRVDAHITLPKVSLEPWNWALSEESDWIAASVSSGLTPASITLHLDPRSLGEGVHVDTVTIALSIEDYATHIRVPVELHVTEGLPAQPQLVMPQDGASGVDADAVLVWDPVPRATAYHLQIATDDAFSSIIVDEAALTDTSYVATGLAGGSTYYWRVRAVGSAGTGAFSSPYRFATATSVGTDSEDLPKTYALEQNYPNPFSASTTIRFELPEPAHVRLAVFDLLGREVARVADQEYAAGHYEVAFDASGLSSGTYVYRIDAGEQSLTRRMILVK